MEAVEEEMAFHQMLRRLGWDFIRVRGSEFYRDRDLAISKLQRRLEEVGISPVDPNESVQANDSDKDSKQATEPLHKRVIKRAELIRTRWKDIPSPAEVHRVVTADPLGHTSETGAGLAPPGESAHTNPTG